MKTTGDKVDWSPVKIKPRLKSSRARRGAAGSPRQESVMDLSLIVKDEDDSNNSNTIDINMALAGIPYLTGEYGSVSGDESKYSNKWPKCAKTYNSKWESDPILKTWIGRHPQDSGKVICRYCHSVIRAHKNDLLEHTRTLKHQRNFQQNTDAEVFNLFVMELNGLRKETTTVQSIPKRKSVGSNSNSNASAKSEFHNSGSDTTTPDSNTDNVNINGNDVPSPSTFGVDGSEVSETIVYHGGESNSNGFSGIDSTDLTDDLHDWETDLQTPRDYLKVELEETAAPPDCDWTRDSEDLPEKCSNLLSHLENGNANENDVKVEYLLTDDSNVKTEPENDSQLTESLAFTSDLQFTRDKNHVSSSQDNQPVYNIQDVLNDLKNGRFNIVDMCSLLKSTAAAIEDMQRSTEQRLSFLASANNTTQIIHIVPNDTTKKAENPTKSKRKRSKRKSNVLTGEEERSRKS